ncbi:DUF6705 family protein [Chryseobacterium hispalense]|uniref:DUF6705 family protein n=1 Tax=Chryseobacterium hispalense TaxID=1453492 RepID=UPI00391890FE
MKQIFLILISIIAISCNAQTISIEEAAQCLSTQNCPDYTYAKDINNSLAKYVGTWKGTFNGKIYELRFNKNLYEDFGIKRDRIKGRLRITTVASSGLQGLTIFDNFNESDDEKTRFSGLGFQPDLKSYMMIFSGPFTKGCMNAGTVYLTVKPSAPNQMKIIYLSETDIVVGECPNTFEQTFPEKKTITLIKQ